MVMVKGRLISLDDGIITNLIQNFYICFGSWLRYQVKNQVDCDLTISQFKVLFMINNLKICNMSSLSDEMEVSKGTMTTMLDKLVEYGLVQRSSSMRDRRTVFVELTDQGQEIVKNMNEKLQLSFTKIVNQLDDKQQEEIYVGLSRLNQLFKEGKCKG